MCSAAKSTPVTGRAAGSRDEALSEKAGSCKGEEAIIVWRAPSRKRAHAHACLGNTPLCKQKAGRLKASFKTPMTSYTNMEHARRQRELCLECERIVSK